MARAEIGQRLEDALVATRAADGESTQIV